MQSKLRKIASVSNWNIPILLIITTIAIQALLFPDYVPTTNDDLKFAINGFPFEAWFKHNRAHFLISGHIVEFFSREAFSIRRVYGLHVIAFYAPIAVSYFYLKKINREHVGIFAFAIAFATQVFGDEHTNPLAYPFTWSLGLAGVAWAALIGGDSLSSKPTKAKWIIYTLIGIASSTIYEPYSAIYCILFMLSFGIKSYNSKDKSRKIWLKALVTSLIPISLILASKVALIIINSSFPNAIFPSDKFGLYTGSVLTIQEPLLSIRVGLNHMIGASILGHLSQPLLWSPQYNPGASPVPLTISFCSLNTCLAFSSFKSFLSKEKASHLHRSNDPSINTTLIGIGFLTATACMVIPTGFTTKYMEWLIISDYNWGHTYITGSLATSLAALATSGLIFGIAENHRLERRTIKQCITLIAIAIASLSIITINHNYTISKTINHRVTILQDFVAACRQTLPEKLVSNEHFDMSLLHTNLPNLPLVHTLCERVNEDTSRFKSW